MRRSLNCNRYFQIYIGGRVTVKKSEWKRQYRKYICSFPAIPGTSLVFGFCLSLFSLTRKKTETEMGVWKHTIWFSFYSMTKTNYAAQISLTVHKVSSVGKRKKSHLDNCYISSFNSPISSKHVFIAVSDFGAKQKNFWILHFQFNFRHPPRQTSNSRGLSQGGGGGCSSFDLIGHYSAGYYRFLFFPFGRTEYWRQQNTIWLAMAFCARTHLAPAELRFKVLTVQQGWFYCLIVYCHVYYNFRKLLLIKPYFFLIIG